MLGTCGIDGVATISGCFFPLISALIFWALTFSTTIAIIFVIISGIRFIFSRGDPKGIDQAKKTFYWSFLGLLLIFMSFFIVNFIGQTTGVSCITKISSGIPTFNECAR